MKQKTTTLGVLSWLVALGGCSIGGTWHTVSVYPPGASFPVDSITFDSGQNYTVSWKQDGKTRTTIGQYKWNGSRLDVVRSGLQPQTYKARVGLDGRLTMTYGSGESKIQAKLERKKP